MYNTHLDFRSFFSGEKCALYMGKYGNLGALCNLVGNQTWNSLKLKHIKCESRESDEELFAYWVDHIENQSVVFILI